MRLLRASAGRTKNRPRPDCRGRCANRLGARARRLAVSAAALALTLYLLAGAGIAGAATDAPAIETSTGGSTVGILIDNTPTQEDVDSGKFTGNDSYLGVLITPTHPESVTVAFMLDADHVYATVPVPYGTLLVRPNDPAWPAELAPPEGVEGTPVFDRWCMDQALTTAYDFSEPVVAPLTLWAAWAIGEPVDVLLDAGAGGVVPDPDDASATPAQTLTVKRYPGAFYRELPVPTKTGYTFAHWATEEGEAIDPAADAVPDGGIRLVAAWKPNTYWVHYAFNDGTGGYRDVEVTYDAEHAFLTWAEVANGASKPYGKEFDGWNTQPDGTGTYYAAGAAMPNLTTEPGGSVSVYAQWKDEWLVEEGPFEVRFMMNDGTNDAYREFVGDDRVTKGDKVAPFDDPKRTGYQFGAWWVGVPDPDDPTAAPQLSRAWSFDEQVMSDLTIYAVWNLRLDVTVPVSVAFAVNAASRTVATPNVDAYAVKSRTVRDVQVEEMAVISVDDELRGFFELPELSAAADDGAAWKAALNKTELWVWRTGDALPPPDVTVRPSGAGGLALPLVNASAEEGEYVRRNDDGTETVIAGWRNARMLKNDAAFRLDAFSYGAAAPDDGWEGEDPSSRLPLKFGMKISDDLAVKVGQAGAVPITHLIVTVSAQG